MNYKRIPALSVDALTPFFDLACGLLGYGRTLKKKALQVAGIQPQDSILDIGSGTATLIILARRQYPQSKVFGVEPDPRALRIAKQKIEKNKVSVGLIAAGAEALPLQASTFEVVISTLVFHHFPTEIKKLALQEIYRILKPEGRFILADFGKSEGVLSKFIASIVEFLRLPEAKTMQDNLQGNIPAFLQEARFEVHQVARKYRGIQFLQAIKSGLNSV